ncbi:unnamed protein product [Angiostrongylus costaricensis]|uniref:Secreted protein n=1 Tax=Angiostrongylus costaricensis TaxID=334426 RepID=A0A0R3PPF4_ANGCS|nr:unnamed protein product [Angiostrongylus costaricensis]VDM58658.1 unnamed protein product [Angiostrongylus costaricensis]
MTRATPDIVLLAAHSITLGGVSSCFSSDLVSGVEMVGTEAGVLCFLHDILDALGTCPSRSVIAAQLWS